MKRHLLYHITPMGSFEDNLELLSDYQHLFNGYRIATVYQGDGLQDYIETTEIINRHLKFDYILWLDNDSDLRETVAFAKLLNEIKQLADDGICFFAHTKGVTYKKTDSVYNAVKLWTKQSYIQNLSDIGRVESALKDRKIAGCFRRVGKMRPLLDECLWHYSGSFFWFKLDELFKCKHEVVMHKYGCESWPGMTFDLSESSCLFGDNCRNLYNFGYLRRLIKRNGNV